MHNRACVLCLTINTKNIIINNTYLQPFYEKLANLKIDNVLCWTCIGCHKRLQQCHQLWQLAEQPQSMSQEEKKTLLALSSSQVNNFCTPLTDDMKCEWEVPVKKEPLNDGDNNSCPPLTHSVKKEWEVPIKSEPIDDDGLDTDHADSNERTSHGEGSTDSENSIHDINNVLEMKLEIVKEECEDINEEEYTNGDRSDDEMAGGLSSAAEDEQVTGPKEEIRETHLYT